jgi:CheY-like chemotaxis protein
LLEQACAQLVVVEGAELALSKCAEQAFDVMLIDLEMPVVDGFTLVKRLRSANTAGAADCRLVACSAHPRSSLWPRCAATGFDEFVEKPIERAELLRVLEACSRKNQPAAVPSP